MIEKVQRRATKILPGFKTLCYTDRLKKLSLPTLAYRRIRGDMIETYKIINNHYDRVAIPFLIPADSNICTRGHNNKLYKLQCNKNVRKYSFCVRIVNFWNSLSEEVITAPSINSFKNRLDKYWGIKKYDTTFSY